MTIARYIPVLLLGALLSPQPGHARDREPEVRMNSSCCDEPTRWGPRHEPRSRQFEVLTENGKASLVLTREVVALQLSDRTMHKVDRELRRKDREDDGPIGEVIRGAVLGGVRALLDHSAECDLRDVRSVRYEAGRLVFIGTDGHRLFERLEMNDDDVLEGFSERDALAFIREFRLARARLN